MTNQCKEKTGFEAPLVSPVKGRQSVSPRALISQEVSPVKGRRSSPVDGYEQLQVRGRRMVRSQVPIVENCPAGNVSPLSPRKATLSINPPTLPTARESPTAEGDALMHKSKLDRTEGYRGLRHHPEGGKEKTGSGRDQEALGNPVHRAPFRVGAAWERPLEDLNKVVWKKSVFKINPPPLRQGNYALWKLV